MPTAHRLAGRCVRCHKKRGPDDGLYCEAHRLERRRSDAEMAKRRQSVVTGMRQAGIHSTPQDDELNARSAATNKLVLDDEAHQRYREVVEKRKRRQPIASHREGKAKIVAYYEEAEDADADYEFSEAGD